MIGNPLLTTAFRLRDHLGIGQRQALSLANAIHRDPGAVMRALNRHLGFSDETTRIIHRNANPRAGR